MRPAKKFRVILWPLLAGALAVPATAQAGSPRDDDHLSYEIRAGDNLYTFAKDYLASANSARRVQTLNRIRNPRRIPVGSSISVPRELLRHKPVRLVVSSWSGPVEIGGDPVKVGMALREGQSVTTGRRGFVSFRATGGGTVSLPSNSQARLERSRRYALGNTLDVSFTVLRGRGRAAVEKLRDQDRFQMRTPVATTAVRGTDFRVSFDPETERSITEVVEGTVAVSAGNETKLTEAEFGVASTAEGVGEREALLPPPPFASPGAIQTGPNLVFDVGEGMAVDSYRVQVARDAGFLDILDEDVSGGGEVEMASIENGRYFVRGRAISGSGIEGLSEAYSFRRKRLGAAATTEPSPIEDGYLFKWAAEGEGNTYFAFQIWDEKKPGRLLVDETGMTAGGIVLTDLQQGQYMWRVAAIQAEEEGLLKVWGPAQKLVVSE